METFLNIHWTCLYNLKDNKMLTQENIVKLIKVFPKLSKMNKCNLSTQY